MGDEGPHENEITPTTPTCSCACHDDSVWRRVKRKMDPTTLLSFESFKSTATASTSTAGAGGFAGVSQLELDQLRETIKAQEEKIQALCDELDEERNASATAANETMAMILRLQGEKAAAQMEARQFKRFADERIAHDDGELEELEEEIKSKDDSITLLSLQIETYRDKLKRHGIEPDGETESESESDDDGRGVVEQPDYKDNVSSETVYNKYAIYQNGMTDNREIDMNMKQIFMRLEALEIAKENTRKDVIALRTEKMQLVLLRDVARRLCAQVAAERKMVSKPSGGKFSVFGVFKWVFSVFFQRSKSRGLFGLNNNTIGFLLLMGMSTRFGQAKTLPRAKR
ncbi:hypothetical protein LUZ60_010264 [Juncus effusus]|nr:hypothetical protein LUZ60_010264 [Juncus effusus]